MKRFSSFWQRVQGDFLFLYTRLAARTARWHIEGKANITLARSSGRPLFWCLWHGQLMQYLMYGDRFDKGSNYVLVAVGDKRHQILDTQATRFGAKTYAADMQGNPLAAGRAVVQVIKAMKRGKQSFIAPDGPDGPPFVAKPGVATIARKADAAVLPVGMWTRHAFQMRRWDHYIIPWPFAHMHMVIGQPITAADQADNQQLIEQISMALDRTRHKAQIAAGIEPWR